MKINTNKKGAAIMNQISSVCEPKQRMRIPKARSAPRALRREVENMLRDVAFVLAQTARVRDAILRDRGEK
jgi:hypothetical protein